MVGGDSTYAKADFRSECWRAQNLRCVVPRDSAVSLGRLRVCCRLGIHGASSARQRRLQMLPLPVSGRFNTLRVCQREDHTNFAAWRSRDMAATVARLTLLAGDGKLAA